MGNPSQPNLPVLNTPFVDERKFVTFPWYAFLNSIFVKTGGASPASKSVTLQLQPDGSIVVIGPDGQVLGPIATTGQTAQPPIGLTPAVSPFIYTAPTNGWIVADSSTTLALSRDGGLTYFQTETDGGQLVMLKGDIVQVTWSGGIPTVVWFGGNT